MKKTIFWSALVLSVAIVLGSIVWIFRGALFEVFDTEESVVAEQKTKVPRKISYLGRIREAEKLIENDYFSLATVELSNAIREKPNLSEPYVMLGEVYLRTGDMLKMTALLKQMETLFPNNPEVLTLKVRKSIEEKKFQEVLTLLETQADILDGIPAVQFYQAVLFALQNDHSSAREILTTLKDLPVKDVTLKVGVQGVEEIKDTEEGVWVRPELNKKIIDFLAVYEEYDELSEGKNPHLFVLLAKSLAENGEPLLAKEFADSAIKEDIGYIDAWVLRGYSQFLMQDYELALSDFRHAYEMDPVRPETHYFMALALYETAQYDEAALFFEKALEHNFEFSDEVKWKLVEIFTEQEKYDKVLELYRELLKEESDPKKFLKAVSTAVDLVRKPELALEFTSLMYKNNPTDSFAMNIHAWALIANEQYIESGEVLEKARKMYPDNPRTYLNLGLWYEEQGKRKQAKDMYKKSYDLGKKMSVASVTNLAAEKYNELLNEPEKPVEPEESRESESP